LHTKRWLVIGVLAPVIVIGLFMLMLLPILHGANERISNLKVAVVNEAGSSGATLERQLVQHLPFTTVTFANESSARAHLQSGDIAMVIRIPSDFAQGLANGHTHLDFELTDALPVTVKSIMQLTEARITQAANAAVLEAMKSRLQQALTQRTPIRSTGSKDWTPQVATLVSQLTQKIGQLSSQPVQANEVIVYPAPAEAAFLPFLTVVTFFIGSIISSLAGWFGLMPFNGSMAQRYSTGLKFVVLSMGAAFLAAVTVVWIAHVYGANPVVGTGKAICVFALAFGAACGLVQSLLYLLKIPGLGLVALTFPLQLLSSGITVPVDMLPQGYQSIVRFLPAMHVTRVVNWMYVGVGDVHADLWWLAGIVIASVLLIALRLAFDGRQPAEAA
jgi:hypothetical protein